MTAPFKIVRTFFDAIGPTDYAGKAETHTAPNIGVISLLCLSASVALLLIALGQGAGRHLHPTLASFYFWGGIILLVLPFASRITRLDVSRGERLFLLVVLGVAFWFYNRLYSPTSFAGYDEFLHWVTANDILNRHRLFLENPLLPVSPFYPAMEIVTSAIGNLAGIDVFPAACILLVLLRAAFITSLFLFIERITGSSRIAGIACLLYMSASTFVVFHAIYSYESMGVVLVVFIMWWETKIGGDFRFLIPAIAILACLAITHHASAILCVLYLIAVVGIEAVRRGTSAANFRMAAGITITALGLVFLWEIVPYNPAAGYLSSAFARQINSLMMVLNGAREVHTPFVSAGGQSQPLWTRFTGIGSVVLISLCLVTGFFRSLTWMTPQSGWRQFVSLYYREWGDSRVLLLTIGALGFPISVLFRLSNGWEIGDRMGTWVFISVGLVVAVALVHYWEGLFWWRRSCTTFVVGAIVFGGVLIGSGSHPIRGPYLVNADEASIDPMGIEAARWTKEWLGSGKNFAADRVNQLLLATYGDQNIVTNIRTSKSRAVDVSYAFLDRTIDKLALASIKLGRINHLEVDLRNTTDRPVLGAYFLIGEPGGGRPMKLAPLLKYDRRPDVSRVFDNGYIIIYNVGSLRSD